MLKILSGRQRGNEYNRGGSSQYAGSRREKSIQSVWAGAPGHGACRHVRNDYASDKISAERNSAT